MTRLETSVAKLKQIVEYSEPATVSKAFGLRPDLNNFILGRRRVC